MVTPSQTGFQYPFGERACEHELDVLQTHYPEYFYVSSRFNQEALETDAYLIVGRRGSGKTSLTQYFDFQERLKNAHSIRVDEADITNTLSRRIGSQAYFSPDLVVNDIHRVWELLLWLLVFGEYCEQDEGLARMTYELIGVSAPCTAANDVFRYILNNYLDDNGAVKDELIHLLASPAFERAKKSALEYTHREPLIISVDTFERYDRENEAMMAITAALIQCANGFNIRHARHGLHVKAFISSEIFPYIKEGNVTNTTKFIRNPVYMNWRPKDLVRLVCWRFKKSLAQQGNPIGAVTVDWENFDDVRTKMWNPFFGEEVINSRGAAEASLPYILRHTQMRPRQLVVLCNAIAREAVQQGTYPYLKDVAISKVIARTETELAEEVLNSYNRIYPGVSDIITALVGASSIFKGNYIDQVAKRTSRFWPDNNYTAIAFRKLVTELGIVGRIRKRNDFTGIIEADFEYFMNDRLVLSDTDECVIHPMFYSKLQVKHNTRYIVYPFPDHPDFEPIRGK